MHGNLLNKDLHRGLRAMFHFVMQRTKNPDCFGWNKCCSITLLARADLGWHNPTPWTLLSRSHSPIHPLHNLTPCHPLLRLVCCANIRKLWYSISGTLVPLAKMPNSRACQCFPPITFCTQPQLRLPDCPAPPLPITLASAGQQFAFHLQADHIFLSAI